MTELLYLSDAYLKEFDAKVLEVSKKGHIRLDRTCFYPGGGGQPCDQGILSSGNNKYNICKVVMESNQIWHIIENAHIPDRGQSVIGVINWDLRYKLMRTHTAMHVLCGVIWRDYGASVTGGNMSPLRGRMDFEFENMNHDLVQEIEAKINVEIDKSSDIFVKTISRDEAFQIPDLIRTKINLLPKGIVQVRTVEIVGLDLQADGGTHVANLSEVGKIEVIDYKSKGKINKRLVVQISSGQDYDI
jgi:misacylated tRNA(Ala) deacylase